MKISSLVALFLIFVMNLQANENQVIKESITLGAGCFWCVEALYDQLKGVQSVESGYMGGSIKNPGYKEVCTGNTGHAEVVKIVFDPKVISLQEILEVFFQVHDPTTLNRQGGDVGTQYRSVIFYESDAQKEIALAVKRQLNIAKVWDNPIVTEISAASVFYKAEDYHQDYYVLNGDNNPYCSRVITPKVEKFKKIFSDKLK
jgi:peptide-methionine (S)-S-oxide reductase